MYSTETELTNDILKLQADILGENVKDDHPYLKKSKSPAKSKQLTTDRGFIVGAINELVDSQSNLDESVKASISVIYETLGQLTSNIELKDRVLAEAPSLIELVLDNSKKIRKNEKIKFHEQNIQVTDNTETFQLDKTGIDFSTFKFYVNGIYYPQNKNFYSVDQENNTVTWLYNESNDGFALKDSEVTINYNYLIETEEEQNNG